MSDGLLSVAMVSEPRRMLERLGLLAIAGSRKGLRESGRGGGSSKGDEGNVAVEGETARLRKGLLEERFSSNPDDRGSKWQAGRRGLRSANRSSKPRRIKSAGFGGQARTRQRHHACE